MVEECFVIFIVMESYLFRFVWVGKYDVIKG